MDNRWRMDQLLKKNSISLTLLQLGQYFVPLIIFPYLARILGVEGFGKLGFATALTMFLVLIVDWGFNLSSTRNIAINRDDRYTCSNVFWNTFLARVIVTTAIIVILVILINIVPKVSDLGSLIWLGVMQVLATTISTTFYYQGIEKMSAMALINLGIRILSIPLIILYVRESDDVELAFAIQTGCFLLASLVNLVLLLRSGQLIWIRPKFNAALRSLLAASTLFLSYAGTSLYTSSNAIILGLVSSEAAVGYFVAGFTLVKAVVGLSGPFAQAIFPRASLLFSQRPEESMAFSRKMFWLQGMLGLLLSAGLLLFMPWGVTWFYGDAFEEAINVVAWLSALPLVVCLASSLGMQTLVPLGKSKWFSTVLIICGVMNCFLLFFLGSVWGAVGAAFAVLLTEVAILIGMALGVKKFAPHLWHELFRFP